MIRPTLVDLNPVELKQYPFIISLDKCTESCNVFQKKQKPQMLKHLIWEQNKNEVKLMAEHISCDCKCKFNSMPMPTSM